MVFNFLNKKTESEQQRIVRYADTIIVNSDYKGELDKTCLDVFREVWGLRAESLSPSLLAIWNDVKNHAPNNYDGTNVNLEITKSYVQKVFDDVKNHLLNNDYISIPNAVDLKWFLTDTGKKMKQLKSHNKYQEYVSKKLKAEIAEMNGKIYWLRRAIIAGIIGFIVGLSTNYLKAKQEKQIDIPKESPKEQQVSPLSTPAKQH